MVRPDKSRTFGGIPTNRWRAQCSHDVISAEALLLLMPRPYLFRKMAASKYPSGVQSDIRTSFTTKEGGYRVVMASTYSRPSRQPLAGKELSQVHVSFVSCKDQEGHSDWVVFNAGRELYFYTFEGVGRVCEGEFSLNWV